MPSGRTNLFVLLFVAFCLQSLPETDANSSKPIENPALGILRSEGWHIRTDSKSGQVVSLSGGRSRFLAEDPEEQARHFLSLYAPLLGLSENLSGLQTVKVQRSLTGQHIRFRQVLNGIPVLDSYVLVHVREGVVTGAELSILAASPPQKPILSREEAVRIARQGLIPSVLAESWITVEPVFLRIDSEVHLCYEVTIPAEDPPGLWAIYIDSLTGKILERRNMAVASTTGRGKVFDPSPIVTLQNNLLLDRNDEDYAELQAAYFEVDLPELDGSGYLIGPFCKIRRLFTNPAYEPETFSFFYGRNDRRFEDTNVYFHVDRAQRRIQSLGFLDANNRQQHIYVGCNPYYGDPWLHDQSYYYPTVQTPSGPGIIAFGTGGVDDGEDAEIVIHEYGHAIQHDQVPGFPTVGEGGAIGEGWSDFWSADQNALVSGGFQDSYLGEWDAAGYADYQCCPPYLRTLVNSKHYPGDKINQVHTDGEIWSAALWAVREEIGSATALTIALQSHYYLTPSVGFIQAASAYVHAASELYGSSVMAPVLHEFQMRGLWPYTVDYSRFQYGGGWGGLVIPTGLPGGVTSEIFVSGSRTISEDFPLEVLVQIDHPNVGRLKVFLTSPSGTRVLIHDRTGRNLNPFEFVYGGNRKPAESLKPFLGENMQGVWSLNIVDSLPSGTGGKLLVWGVPHARTLSGVPDWANYR